MMWKYIRKYLHFAVPAAAFMVGEVMMDLVQPGLMSRIIDEGVLGLHHQGTGDIRLIFTLGLGMIGLVVSGGQKQRISIARAVLKQAEILTIPPALLT